MLAEKLKEATKNSHQQLEKALIGKLKAISTPADYASLLKLFYSYFGGLEEKINQSIDASVLTDSAERRKTQAIANDLSSLESQIPVKATGDELPQIDDHLQALGALYVIEGSTLGGKIISKMMQQQLGEKRGMSFFTGYGERTNEMWGKFKEVLNNQTSAGAEEQRVIAAANQTFLKFGDWFNRHSL